MSGSWPGVESWVTAGSREDGVAELARRDGGVSGLPGERVGQTRHDGADRDRTQGVVPLHSGRFEFPSRLVTLRSFGGGKLRLKPAPLELSQRFFVPLKGADHELREGGVIPGYGEGMNSDCVNYVK